MSHAHHDTRKPTQPKKKVSTTKPVQKQSVTKVETPKAEIPMEKPQSEIKPENSQVDDIMIVTKTGDDGNRIEFTNEDSMAAEDRGPESPPTTPIPPPSTPKTFDVKSFPQEVTELTDLFSSPRFSQVGADYPVDEVVSAVNMVTGILTEYKSYALSSQQNLEELRNSMQAVRDNIQGNVRKRGQDVDPDNINQSEEEMALTEKLARLNAELSRANVELAEVVKMAAETESTAIRAAKAAEESVEQAKRVQEDAEMRVVLEERRKREEIKKLAQEKLEQEEMVRREAEVKRLQELEWKKRDGTLQENEKPTALPLYPFESPMGSSDFSVYCVIRASSTFDDSAVSCDFVDQSHINFVYSSHEEIVSPIIKLGPAKNGYYLKEPVTVCIPFITSRLTAVTREPLIKCWDGGQWTELFTKEVTLDSYKEYKFAQAEIHSLSTLAVTTRFKRDYFTFDPAKTSRGVSSADHRITVTVPEGCVPKPEHLVLQVQPIDSASLADVKSRNPPLKNLLTSSPILHMEWEIGSLKSPVTITSPCPPNPAKAKKMAALRAQKEAKMNKNQPEVFTDESERLKAERAKKRSQALAEMTESETPKKREKRWYMGAYGGGDDDENDRLVLLQCSPGGRWTVNHDVDIVQVKMDLLQFDTIQALDKFIILRMRLSVEENDDDELIAMVATVDEYLGKRLVNVVLKQRSDDAFDAIIHIIPSRRVDRILQSLEQEKYTGGPGIGQEMLVKEGDIIEVEFRGNIAPSKIDNVSMVYNSHLKTSASFTLSEVDQYLQKDFGTFHGVILVDNVSMVYNSHLKTSASFTLSEVDQYLQKDFGTFHGVILVDNVSMVYNSHLKTSASFTLSEVDQYLQKDFGTFHGVILVYRKFRVIDQKAKGDQKALRARKASVAAHTITMTTEEVDDRPMAVEYSREQLCDRVIHIPKYHVEASSAPRKACVIIEEGDAVNEPILRHVSSELGEEWKKLAHYLNVRRTRVQAIVRNSVIGDTGEEEARFDMLVTWWKRVPRASNKSELLSRSLEKCGRHDLATEVRLNHKMRRQSAMEVVVN